MAARNIKNRYYKYLIGLICNDYQKRYYTNVMDLLFETEFYWVIPEDSNRAFDGCDLRRRFCYEYDIDPYLAISVLDGPCSVLEMMVGLAVRCEESIMEDDDIGNRTGNWFWIMMYNLHLEGMDNGRFDYDYVIERLHIFLERKYEKNGDGSLFTVKKTRKDMRKVELWYQMNWYLNEIS